MPVSCTHDRQEIYIKARRRGSGPRKEVPLTHDVTKQIMAVRAGDPGVNFNNEMIAGILSDNGLRELDDLEAKPLHRVALEYGLFCMNCQSPVSEVMVGSFEIPTDMKKIDARSGGDPSKLKVENMLGKEISIARYATAVVVVKWIIENETKKKEVVH